MNKNIKQDYLKKINELKKHNKFYFNMLKINSLFRRETGKPCRRNRGHHFNVRRRNRFIRRERSSFSPPQRKYG